MNAAKPENLAYIGKKPGDRESDEWYTPVEYVEKARETMGRIDLDPFSCESANAVIKAKRIFTLQDSALGRDWSPVGKVTVWMNPPYGRGTLGPAIQAFLCAWFDGQISQAVVLVNNATETQWFQSVAAECTAMCLVSKRIAFYNTDGKETNGNTRGQVFFYFGHRLNRFYEVFGDQGVVLCK